MWKILLADYQNNRFTIMISLIIISIPIAVNQLQSWPTVAYDITGIRSLMLAAIVLTYLLNFNRSGRQKNDRLRIMLPLPHRKIGVARLLFGISVWALLCLMLILGTANIRPYPTVIIFRPLLAATGLVLILNAFPFILRDLFFCFPEKNLKSILAASYFLIILAVYFLGYILTSTIPYFTVLQEFDATKASLNQQLISTPAIIILNLIGLVLSGCSIALFIRRKLYLE